jgi:hypothetical protein
MQTRMEAGSKLERTETLNCPTKCRAAPRVGGRGMDALFPDGMH